MTIKVNKIRVKMTGSNSQLDVIGKVKNLYNSRQKIIDLLNDNSRIRSEAIYKSKQKEQDLQY